MMDDQEILQRLLQKAYTDDALDQAARAQYEKLVLRFPEDGAELELPLNDLDEKEEKALRNLSNEGYTAQSLRYHGSDMGHILHVNLHGKKYLDFANQHAAGPQNELPLGCDNPLPLVVGLDSRKNENHQPEGNMRLSMQDSGERQTFETGAVRDTAEGKSRPDLISPFATERLGDWLMLGAQKYSERNWERGIPISRTIASLHRHLMKYQQGSKDEDHLAAIMCNAMFLLHTEEMVKRGVLLESLLDMPEYRPPNVHQNGDEPYET